MFQVSFDVDGRVIRPRGVLLKAQPKPPELPRALKDANVEELIDRYMYYKGMGAESLPMRLIAQHTRLLPPSRARPPSARRPDPGRRESLARAKATTPQQVDAALEVKPVATDTNNKIPVMLYGSLVGQPPFRGAFIGPTGCGKSTLVAHLIAHHYGEWFCNTGGGVHYYSKTLSTDEIAKDEKTARFLKKKVGKFDENELRTLMDTQKDLVKKQGKDRAPHVLLVLSDFASEEDKMKSPLMKELFMSSRHYNISILIDTQKLSALPPAVRGNCQLFFAFDCAGYEEELYERNLRVRNMPVASFRDVVQYALTPTAEQREAAVKAARERGVLLPEAARVSTFLTINLQSDPAAAYRRGLGEILPLEDGWVVGEHAEACHGRNPKWLKSRSELRDPPTGDSVDNEEG